MTKLPEIYPKPVMFYQRPEFEGQRFEELAPDTDLSAIRLFDADEHFTARIFSQLRLTKYRHVGRLRGEFLVQYRCLLAQDRHAAAVKLNTDALDDWSMSSLYFELEFYCAKTAHKADRADFLQKWDSAPVARDVVVLGGTHADHNYYHFSVCMVPQVRHYADVSSTCIGLPAQCLERPFQRDLVRMTFGHRTILPLPDGVRVIDPLLIYEPVTRASIQWLSTRSGLKARRGNRLIFIDRTSSQTGRVGGAIEKTKSFLAFLEHHGFETVNFGVGGVAVADQVAMLEGARVILSSHGANLTNIAYLAEGVSVIEVMPYYWTYFSHMQIASAVGLRYFGVVCHEVTAGQNSVLGLDVLEEALEAAMAATTVIGGSGRGVAWKSACESFQSRG